MSLVLKFGRAQLRQNGKMAFCLTTYRSCVKLTTMKKIKFCSHAELKFRILKKHGINFTKSQIEEVVSNPDRIIKAEKSRRIAQKIMNAQHVLRVIFEESKDSFTVITFYPARRSRYED